jgi:hypothetical protein
MEIGLLRLLLSQRGALIRTSRGHMRIWVSWRQHGSFDEGISGVRPDGRQAPNGAQGRDSTSPCRTPRKVGTESPQAGTEAEGQVAFRKGRGGGIRQRLVPVWTVPESDQILVGQATTDNPKNGKTEAVSVVQIFPVIEPERLFLEIPKQVKQLNRYIGASQPLYRCQPTPLQQAPVMFQPVGVAVLVDICDGTVTT